MLKIQHTKKGFTLVETVVSVAIFTMIFMAVYGAYAKIFELIALSRARAIAMAFVNERIEIARNLPYGDVGTPSGIPRGVLPPVIEETRSNMVFEVTTTVRNIDDPFDGLIGGTPNDTSPADYKLVDMTITCLSCKNLPPFSIVTYIAPKNLEISSSTNGALFVDVRDASGLPVSGAFVHIENPSTTPPIIIDDITGTNGMLQLVDIPPGVEAYQIVVTKDGYTVDQTMTRGDSDNPNPTKPHATIIPETVTALTMSIDRVSAFSFNSKTSVCSAVPNVSFDLAGSRLIGTLPDVKKYQESASTDAGGQRNISNMEWDTYNLLVSDDAYHLIGTNALSPFALLPGETKTVDLIVAPKDPNALIVAVKDGATQLPISGATVKLSSGMFSETLITGRGFLGQTDWSSGGGQATSTNLAKYWSSDGNTDVGNPAGEIKLREAFGTYVASGVIESSTFDSGSASNFHEITWLPQSQHPATGGNSVQFQVATNNDGGVWNFKGPDGTSATYYEVGTSSIHSTHNGDRYFRYKIFLSTASSTYTPSVSDVAFTFTSDCVPSGQVAFTGFGIGDYDLTITKTGYQTYYASTTILQPWQALEVSLTP